MDAEGYLFLPGALHRDEVLAARRVCAERLAAKKMLREGSDPMDCLIRPGQDTGFDISLAKDNAPLMKVLYDGPMMAVCEQLIGGPVLHFDYTWFRAVAPNRSTPPHMDIVYMGRGTQRLYTAWTPIGDVPLETGGLLVLERSHKHERLNNGYGREPGWTEMGGGGNIRAGGALSNDPIKLRDRLGGRWLTADFAAGDVLLFSVFTVHCSLDNRSQSIRLSSDSRYQSAAEPADHRWIGPDPIAHGPAGKRGMIC
jgi:hypothetical protein